MTILKWTCPVCGKEIKSLYQAQLDSNKAAHILTHDPKTSIEVGEEGEAQENEPKRL